MSTLEPRSKQEGFTVGNSLDNADLSAGATLPVISSIPYTLIFTTLPDSSSKLTSYWLAETFLYTLPVVVMPSFVVLPSFLAFIR